MFRRILILVALLTSAPAFSEERLALVIGNAAYRAVSPLENPPHDARLVGSTLESLGFTVTLLVDGSQGEMKRAISEFGRALRAAGPEATGLFYYAGHGVQSFGTNYLLPVDVALQDAADLDLMAVEAQSVLRQMYSAKNRTNIVILDACRNNPFTDIPEFNDNGLAEMQAPTGTFLSYATAPGDVALDGLDGNSPFTKAFVEQMQVPGQPLEQTFKEVRVAVLEATFGNQTPWDASSLTTDFMFKPDVAQSPEEMAEGQLWRSVQSTRDAVQIMLFMRAYPQSPFVEAARTLLSEVMAEEIAIEPSAYTKATGGPSEAEKQLYARAQETGTVEAWRRYLQVYPTGSFAELARTEVIALTTNKSTDPEGSGVTPKPAPSTETASVGAPQRDVFFDQPIVADLALINGKTFEEVLQESPAFAPIEGMPEAYWKEDTCNDCHSWTREDMCEQGTRYTAASAERSLGKQHPFGGALKQVLRDWAAGGCR